jgi:hypothetical protein
MQIAQLVLLENYLFLLMAQKEIRFFHCEGQMPVICFGSRKLDTMEAGKPDLKINRGGKK